MARTTEAAHRESPGTSTRIKAQSLAEHLLAADLFHHTGKIGLRQSAGGFGQPEFFADGQRRRLRIDGTRLSMVRGDSEVWTDISTLGELASFTGVEPGAPSEVFTPTTAFDPDADLSLDPNEAHRLADFQALANTALEVLRSRNADRSPVIVQLWPEHFDLATNMSEINFGASAGDSAVDEPYFYVGPWTPRAGEFWNVPFGAVLVHNDMTGVGDVLEFFEQGLELATV